MTVQTTQTVQNHDISTMSEDKINLLKNTICKDATDNELQLFLHACNRSGLDPFMRQIYFIKISGKMSIITAIDGYRLIAERSKRYMPGRETTFTYGKDGHITSATSYVKKLGPDNTWHEVGVTAVFSEYVGTGPLWKSKPHVMISKCSEALALRKAFPSDLSGIYTKEELEGDEVMQPKAPPELLTFVETISSEEAQDLENILSSEDASYRHSLLKYYTNKNKLSAPMTNFFSLPKDCLLGCLRAIDKRKIEREKLKKLEESGEIDEEFNF